MRNICIVVLVSTFAVPAVGSEQASDRWVGEAQQKLTRIVPSWRDEGWTLSHKEMSGRLNENASTTFTIELEAGMPYRVVAFCDSDCSDLDLGLYRGKTLIDSDVDEDANPIVQIVPDWKTTYLIRVTMAKCSNSPCRFVVGVFAR